MALREVQASESKDDPDATRIVLRADPPSGLKAGTRLRDFEIERVIGEGGFSIVYGAVDLNLRRRVALKEYMPAAIARRGEDRTVQPRTGRDSEIFDLGRRSFLNEARLLARFDHPALVKVHQFWEENGTAYMVMPLYEGRTLKQWLKDRAQPPGEEELKRIVAPLLDALEHLHAESVFHRDVAPDNILLLGDERPVLLDFGAARQVLVDSDKALTAILKPSYAPIEQYADMAQLKQGPWTDVYALCAVLYFAITGAAPPSAVARSIDDKMVPALTAGSGRYSARFLRGIDAGLRARPEARPQSIAQFRELLFGGPATAAATVTAESSADASGARSRGGRPLVAAAGVVALLGALGAGIWVVSMRAPTDSVAPGAPGATDDIARPTPPETAPPAAAADSAAPSEPRRLEEKSEPRAIQSTPAVTPSPSTPLTRPQLPNGASPPMTAPVSPRTPGRSPPVEPAVQRAEQAPREEPLTRGTPAAVSRTRCLQILQRMQLGEMPSPEEKSFMRKECS